MYIYKNGDPCPCCGQPLRGKSDAWLQEFSETCAFLGFPLPNFKPPGPQRTPEDGKEMQTR